MPKNITAGVLRVVPMAGGALYRTSDGIYFKSLSEANQRQRAVNEDKFGYRAKEKELRETVQMAIATPTMDEDQIAEAIRRIVMPDLRPEPEPDFTQLQANMDDPIQVRRPM